MSSKTPPLRYHYAMLNSVRAIEMLGGGIHKVIAIDGHYSKRIASEVIVGKSPLIENKDIRLEMHIDIKWKSQGDDEAKTISEILKEVEPEECPDIFLTSITIIKPWEVYNETLMCNKKINVPFIFHAHPFKPSVFARLKGRMPSFQLYSHIQEIRKILSVDLDEDTRKRWRDILLINYPHESLTNEEIRRIWNDDPSVILLKESKGKFDLMEIDEGREA